jgi:tripartite-type tricarboxylate transporter receptor subunit TctC
VVVVGPSLKVETLADLVADARKRPGALTYASASHASASHLATLLLERAASIKVRHVPYRGASPALSDVVGGHVDFMVTTIPSATGLATEQGVSCARKSRSQAKRAQPERPAPPLSLGRTPLRGRTRFAPAEHGIGLDDGWV